MRAAFLVIILLFCSVLSAYFGASNSNAADSPQPLPTDPPGSISQLSSQTMSIQFRLFQDRQTITLRLNLSGQNFMIRKNLTAGDSFTETFINGIPTALYPNLANTFISDFGTQRWIPNLKVQIRQPELDRLALLNTKMDAILASLRKPNPNTSSGLPCIENTETRSSAPLSTEQKVRVQEMLDLLQSWTLKNSFLF